VVKLILARQDFLLGTRSKSDKSGMGTEGKILMEIILVKEKETPGTWRFKEDKGDRPMTIYLTKEQVKELGSPQQIKVTISPV
jgi:hypothetical protein